MRVQVLGTGCAKCRALMANAQKAVQELANGAIVEKVEDILEIRRLGVMTTPALLVDGKVKSAGRVLSPEAIQELLQK